MCKDYFSCLSLWLSVNIYSFNLEVTDTPGFRTSCFIKVRRKHNIQVISTVRNFDIKLQVQLISITNTMSWTYTIYGLVSSMVKSSNKYRLIVNINEESFILLGLPCVKDMVSTPDSDSIVLRYIIKVSSNNCTNTKIVDTTQHLDTITVEYPIVGFSCSCNVPTLIIIDINQRLLAKVLFFPNCFLSRNTSKYA